MNYRIGLDIGIASVGWAVLENDENDAPIRIADIGCRTFDRAEQPKTGASLAEPRRMARGARRRLRRRRHRKERIKYLMETEGIISVSDLDALFSAGEALTNVYQLRCEGLGRLLAQEDWARVLLHFAQRRGYHSSSKAEEAAENDSKRVLSALESNRSLMSEKRYRTIGEMLWKDEKFKGYTGSRKEAFDLHTRNKAENYTNTMPRKLLLDEVALLFEAQRGFGSQFAGEEFQERYLTILSGQRSFDEGVVSKQPNKKSIGTDESQRPMLFFVVKLVCEQKLNRNILSHMHPECATEN